MVDSTERYLIEYCILSLLLYYYYADHDQLNNNIIITIYNTNITQLYKRKIFF